MITTNSSSKQQLINNCVSIAKDLEKLSEASFYEYLDDVLELRYIIDSNFEYLGSELLITYGGPTIWVNTLYNKVKGSWGMDVFETHYSNQDLDDFLNTYFQNTKIK